AGGLVERRKERPLSGKLAKVFERDAGICAYCHARLVLPEQHRSRQRSDFMATLDHVIPKCRGGTNHLDNLVLACRRCNSTKGDMSVVHFLFMLRFNGVSTARELRLKNRAASRERRKAKVAVMM